MPLAVAGVWLILLPALPERRLLRFGPAIAAIAVVPIVALVAWRMGNTALANVAERFVFSDDGRRQLWRDGWFAMSEAWPLGIGVGGAQPALVAAERLEVLDPALPNRVHNDYLELALEGGLPALILLAAIALVLAAAAWRTWRRRPDERHLTALGLVTLLVVALHSFVDYPPPPSGRKESAGPLTGPSCREPRTGRSRARACLARPAPRRRHRRSTGRN